MASKLNLLSNLHRRLLPSQNGLVKVILPLLSAGAFYALFINDDTIRRILAILLSKPVYIPRTEEPMRLRYTGIPPIDYWLTIMVLFFWEALDGSHPDTSLSGVYFLGQLISIWALLWMEGLRRGNAGLIVSRTTLWACAMQNLALACFGPVYFTIYLCTSRTVLDQSRHSNSERSSPMSFPSELRLLPFSLTLGYIIPSIIIALPSPNVVSHDFQQAVIAVWSFFPIGVAVIQALLSRVTSSTSPVDRQSPQSPAELAAASLRVMRPVYTLAFAGSAIFHIATATLSLTALLFPTIYAPGYATALHPSHVSLPANTAQVGTIGQGVLRFMQLDQWIGYSAVLLWASTMYRSASVGKVSGWKHSFNLLMTTLGLAVVAGPGGAAVGLVWARDEMVLGEVVRQDAAGKMY
ncbi:MAG: hypothetical protein M1816_000508 [Peltula sp. TS41687]|nr:MAG: hypothetical protein M1816_000508 [Peltula sp. TS41687]